jgi:hypothetical protein
MIHFVHMYIIVLGVERETDLICTYVELDRFSDVQNICFLQKCKYICGIL